MRKWENLGGKELVELTTSGAKGLTRNAPPTALGEEFRALERAL